MIQLRVCAVCVSVQHHQISDYLAYGKNGCCSAATVPNSAETPFEAAVPEIKSSSPSSSSCTSNTARPLPFALLMEGACWDAADVGVGIGAGGNALRTRCNSAAARQRFCCTSSKTLNRSSIASLVQASSLRNCISSVSTLGICSGVANGPTSGATAVGAVTAVVVSRGDSAKYTEDARDICGTGCGCESDGGSGGLEEG